MGMRAGWAKWILAVLFVTALPVAWVWANGAPIHGGPVIIGTDEADDTGDFRDNECRGCGPGNADSSCTNTCVTDLACEDPARTLFAGSPGTGDDGGSCRQFDDDPEDCERAWHYTSQGYPSPCFVCQDTNGQCENVGECRGCGGNNLRNATGCTQTCFTCRDTSRTDFVGSPGEGNGGGSCREHDGSQGACESAWHFDDNGRPTSCFFCTDEVGQCESAGECRGCGRSNRAAGVCEDTCLPCSDSSRTLFADGRGLGDGDDGSSGKSKSRGIGGPVGAPGACRAFDGDASSCNQAWHLDNDGLPASCFFDDRGNIDGYRYIQDGFEALGPKVRNANKLAVCLGCNGNPALEAFESGFDESSLPSQGWTREVLTAIDDLEDFFDSSGAVKIGATGIIYLPSDDSDNRDPSGIVGPASCRGCGPAHDLNGRCENSCTLAPPATCLDVTRTVNAGGPRTGACQQFADEASCEEAWHTNQRGVPSICRWDGSECLGCGKNNSSACTNTCVPAPTCDDVGRTIARGGPGSGLGCRNISNQTDCEQAWHVTGAFVGVSCYWNGGCLACSPRNELGGSCVNDCGSALPTPTCADGGRTNALGGPQASACHQFDFDPEGCATAWHVTRNGRAASCYMPPNQIAVVNQNALAIGAFVSNGGGFFAHSLRDTPTGYDWLTTLLPELLVSRNDCQDRTILTPDGAAAFGVLTDDNLGSVRRLEGGFAGDIGGLAVLGTQSCLHQPLRCTDPARTRFLTSDRACRALDGDQTACEEGWHIDNDGIPTTCFFCTDDDGGCEAAGECRGCGRDGNGRDGVCNNTCIDGDSPLCADKSRTALAPPGRGQNSSGESCLALSGDPGACLAAWHFDRAGSPASCFVCDEADTSGSGRGCDAVGDCRGCGFRNESVRELCDNDCGLGPRVCGDRKRKIFADDNGGCRQFNGNPASCAEAWEFSNDAPVSCFVCQGAEGDCDRAGECETCSASNQRRGVCENTCGLPPGGVDRAAIIGGMQVTFEPRLDHFEGYKLKKAPKLPKNCHLALDDTLSTGWDGPIEYTASKVTALLAPADKSEKGGRVAPFPPTVPELDALIDEATHLVAYQIKRKKGQVPSKHQKQLGVLVQNQFGTLRFDTDKEDRFLAPANKDFKTPPPMPSGGEVDHYKCYKIKVAKRFPGSQQDAKGKFVKRQAIVVDQFESGRPYTCQAGSPKGIGKACKDDKACGGDKGAFAFCEQTEGHPEFEGARVYDLKKPTRYCVPVAKSTGTDSDCVVTPTGPPKQEDQFLTCYQKKVASKDGLTGKEKILPKQAKHVPRPVFVHSWLAEHQFSTSKEEELCVPSRLMEVNP